MSWGAWPRVDVPRTPLELRRRAALRPAAAPPLPVRLQPVRPIAAPEYRAFYAVVGERWFWRDRLVWTDDELDAYLAAPNVHLWPLSGGGQTARYFEPPHHATRPAQVRAFCPPPAVTGAGPG